LGQVFVSYAREDKAIAFEACAHLEKAGMECWIAPRDIEPGEPYPSEIQRGLEASALMLQFYSQHVPESPWVLREVEGAVSAGLPIIPVRLDDSPLVSQFRLLVGINQWIEDDPDSPGFYDFLVKSCQRALSRGGKLSHVRPEAKPIEKSPRSTKADEPPTLQVIPIELSTAPPVQLPPALPPQSMPDPPAAPRSENNYQIQDRAGSKSPTLWIAITVVMALVATGAIFSSMNRKTDESRGGNPSPSGAEGNGAPGTTGSASVDGKSSSVTTARTKTVEYEVRPSDVTMSSSNPSSDPANKVDNIIDGNRLTAWQETARVPISEKWVQASFSQPQKFARLEIVVGYDKPAGEGRPDRWDYNLRLKRAVVSVGGKVFDFHYEDKRGFQSFDLPDCTGSTLKIRALEAYPGTNRDLCISEIKIFTLREVPAN
jgi:hypothetical protein